MLMFLWFFSVLSLSFQTHCPNSEYIFPCSCEKDSDETVSIECKGVDNGEEIVSAMEYLKTKRVSRIVLQETNLKYLPHDLFKDIIVEEIELLDSSFFSLSDDDNAFVGLESSLAVLAITDCRFMSGWDWSHLKKLEELFRIDILGGDMDSIGPEVSAIHHLPIVDLAFSRNEISWIDDTAFAKHQNLKFLSLDYNQIGKLKRSMLPKPANHLMFLNFGNNKLQDLDDDLFSEMPTLTNLFLENNLLTTLNEKSMLPIWRQLEFFGAMGNPMKCDCRIMWMTKTKSTVNQRVVCVQPDSLKGRLTYTLTQKDLYC